MKARRKTGFRFVFPARCHAILLADNWNGLTQTSDVRFVELLRK